MFQWNNNIQTAQEKTGKVTAKQLRAVLATLHKKGLSRCSVSIHANAVYGRPSYSDAFVFTLTAHTESRVKGEERSVTTDTKIDCPGYVANGHTSVRDETKGTVGSPYMMYCETFRPTKGFLYLSYEFDRIEGILALLPGDAEIAFYMALDAGTHEYLVRADCTINGETHHGFHADIFYMAARVTRGGKSKDYHFMIDADALPHNSARFGVGG